MLDVIVIAGTSLMFLFGWFLMKRLDRFLDENRKRIEKEIEQQPELCVRLNGDISTDELKETLSRFCGSHAHVEIVVYDSEQILFPGSESDWIR